MNKLNRLYIYIYLWILVYLLKEDDKNIDNVNNPMLIRIKQ